MANTDVPRPKAPQILVDENGRATREFHWYLFQLWLRTGGADDAVAGALVSGNNLSDVQSASDSRDNLGFVDPILDKSEPGPIGATTPAAINGTSGTFSTTLTITGKFFVDANNNVAVGTGALATTATNGFLYIPTTAGNPTGVPTAKTGLVAMVYDSTNDELFIYNGAWRSVAVL